MNKKNYLVSFFSVGLLALAFSLSSDVYAMGKNAHLIRQFKPWKAAEGTTWYPPAMDGQTAQWMTAEKAHEYCEAQGLQLPTSDDLDNLNEQASRLKSFRTNGDAPYWFDHEVQHDLDWEYMTIKVGRGSYRSSNKVTGDTIEFASAFWAVTKDNIYPKTAGIPFKEENPGKHFPYITYSFSISRNKHGFNASFLTPGEIFWGSNRPLGYEDNREKWTIKAKVSCISRI